MKVYVNGSLAADCPTTGTIPAYATALQFAHYANLPTGVFYNTPLALDEIAVYSTALSAARVLAHYRNGQFG